MYVLMDRGNWRVSATRGKLPLLALYAVSEYSRLDRKPPVTAGLIAVNTLVYLRPGFLDPILPSIDEVWFNPHLIVKHKDLKRFFLSAFYHLNDTHLVLNMLSLLWKGIQLETSMGSVEFVSMVTTLLGMSQGITLLLAKSLVHFFDYNNAYYNQYAVGFSGVLFAMKVLLNYQSDNYTYVHGILVRDRYAAWAELLVIQMCVPNASFLGHLGGILAGLLYLRLKASYSGPNLLTWIVRYFFSVVSWPLTFAKRLFGFQQQRIFAGGTIGGSQTRSLSAVWRCPACTFDNSDWLSICEMCGTSRDGDLSPLESSDHTQEISLEELRRRRVERFGR